MTTKDGTWAEKMKKKRAELGRSLTLEELMDASIGYRDDAREAPRAEEGAVKGGGKAA